MIRAMVWKEFREQGLIALTLLVLGAGILVAAAVLGEPPASAGPADIVRALGAGRLATLMLAVTAGMVCGGALFAAERESGTIGFLEALPASRWQVWRAKVSAGAVLAVVQVLGVLAVAALLGLAPPDFALRVAIYAALAFVWGAYGSTVSQTTLGSVGVAIPCALLAAVGFLVPIILILPHPGTNLPRPEGELLFLALMVGVPLLMSAAAFTRLDRDRASDDIRPEAWLGGRVGRAATAVRSPAASPRSAPDRRASRFGLKALLWLATRQLFRTALVLSAFAVLFGLMMLAPGAKPFLMWPSLALCAGVFAGATVMGDEQARGTARFWGDWRLPAGRMWAVKVAVHLAFALWLVFLLALPLVVRAHVLPDGPVTRGQSFLSAVFGTLLFDELERQGWKLVFLPVAYGFAAGHLCGMLFKKVVVAVGVATLVGGTAAALWIPSLMGGGVHHWQVWLPPALTLLVARLLVRAWASNRLATRGPVVTLAAGGAGVLLVLAAGLGYRVLEVPSRADGEADILYIAAMPSPEDNAAGRDIRGASERFARLAADSVVKTGPRRVRIEERVDGVTATGWGAEYADVGAFLGDVYRDRGDAPDNLPWFALANRAADEKLGMFEDPRLMIASSSAASLENVRRMAAAVVARGLQAQAAGDPAEFVRSLRTALGAARNVRNGSVVAAVNVANAIERGVLLVPVETWLANLDGRPDLIRAALAAVLAADPPEPFDPTPHLLAERHTLREQMKSPSQWVPDLIAGPGKVRNEDAVEGDLVAFAWAVPWERERTRRLVGLGFESTVAPEHYQLLRGRPGRGFMAGRFLNSADLVEYDRLVRVLRRAAAVRLAVRLYQAEKGRVPASPAELVAAGYLPAVPRDPYDDAPLRYRVSAGEQLVGPRDTRAQLVQPAQTMELPRGQVVVWSVGPNKSDEGGRQMPFLPTSLLRADDLVFLVPADRNLPPAPPK